MKQARSDNRTGQVGFTLIELMVVIAVIVLLLTMIAPTVSYIRLMGANTVSQARITELAGMCDQFKLDTKYYPGQRDRPTWDPNSGITPLTGSQILAKCLFFSANDPNTTYASIAAGTAQKDPRYGSLEPGDLIEPNDVRNLTVKLTNTILDRFGKDPMPVLYYPSKLGVSGLNQYAKTDNQAYTGDPNIVRWPTETSPDPNDPGDPNDGFNVYITDTRAGGSDPNATTVSGRIPYNDRGFLIIGAGIDRLYGTEDDIRNWTPQE